MPYNPTKLNANNNVSMSHLNGAIDWYDYLDCRYDPEYPISFRRTIQYTDENDKTTHQYRVAGYFDWKGNILLDPLKTGYSYVQGLYGNDMSDYSEVGNIASPNQVMYKDGTILPMESVEMFEPIWMGDKYYYKSGGSKESGYSYSLYDENMNKFPGTLSGVIPGYYIMYYKSDGSYSNQKLYNTDGILLQENLNSGSPWLHLAYDQYTREAYYYEEGARSVKIYSLPDCKLIYQNDDNVSYFTANGSIFTFKEWNGTGDGPHHVIAIKDKKVALDVTINTYTIRASWYYPGVVEVKYKGYNEWKDTFRYFDLNLGEEQTVNYAHTMYQINEYFDHDQYMKLSNYKHDDWSVANMEGYEQFNEQYAYDFDGSLLDYNMTSQLLKAGIKPYICMFNWEFGESDEYYFALYDPNTKSIVFSEQSTKKVTGPVAFLSIHNHKYIDSPILVVERIDGTFSLINIANGAYAEIRDENYKLVYLAKNHVVFAKYSQDNPREQISYRIFNAYMNSWDLSASEYYFKDSW